MFAGIADEGLGRNEGGPADTPAWEPEIEAPASMQMAVEAPASMRYALRAWLCARARCIHGSSKALPRGAFPPKCVPKPGFGTRGKRLMAKVYIGLTPALRTLPTDRISAPASASFCNGHARFA
jgi:hypothetical protein